MYAEHLAWLQATPTHENNKIKSVPRINSMNDDNVYKQLPKADEFIIMCFHLLDVCRSGDSLTPFTWTDVRDFNLQSGYNLDGWQSEQLVKMSRYFCSFFNKAKDVNCTPPYFAFANSSDEMKAKQRAIVAEQQAERRRLRKLNKAKR